MPMTPRARLAEDRLHPRIVDLWFALQALGSPASFCQTGAHPDDETSGMLAALRFRDGLSTAYVCATRGEGGQNDIGREAGAALGALRTAEMERAADRLDARLWWLSEGPDDAIFDFGFSKSGDETLGRWGRERVRARLVEILRRERPDAICPTFLDVPGQHGHHRAMTQMAAEAFAAAADPAFPSDLPPWEVAKLYLPAWGGGGTAYDDEVPPPPETVRVAGGVDPVSGWPYDRIGQWSRACHLTQGMGAWVPANAARDWPLHLAESRVGPDASSVADNLPTSLADLGQSQAAQAIDEARAAFPDMAAVAAGAARALSALDGAAADHRLARKARELARVLRLALGVEARGRVARDWLVPGERARVETEMAPGRAEDAALSLDLAEGWIGAADEIGPAEDAPPSDPYPTSYDPLDPPRPRLRLRMGAAEIALPLEVPPVVLPPRTAALDPAALVLNLAAPRPLSVRLSGQRPEGAEPALHAPDGWRVAREGPEFRIEPPADRGPGLAEMPLTLDGAPAMTETRLAPAHAAPRVLAVPAVLRIRTLEARLAGGRIGYVGGGNDNVLAWLQAMGAAAEALSDDRLRDGLDGLDALVVGVFAFRTRPALAEARLADWVSAGGTLLTLYHRPWDAWDPSTTPPAPLEIGQPSLRWRVTDETAEVSHLAPDHPVLNTPNRIGPEDWTGWVKERGLYFAKSWDGAYSPLLEMADPGEAPHRGALLSAEIGAGRHSHCALGLHVQMEALVPGAFRLLANLVAPR